LRSGQVAFDLPAAEISTEMLRDLYSSEGSIVPTQANDPALLHGLTEPPLEATGANVVRLDSCRGRG
jgi:hypothetical protein